MTKKKYIFAFTGILILTTLACGNEVVPTPMTVATVPAYLTSTPRPPKPTETPIPQWKIYFNAYNDFADVYHELFMDASDMKKQMGYVTQTELDEFLLTAQLADLLFRQAEPTPGAQEEAHVHFLKEADHKAQWAVYMADCLDKELDIYCDLASDEWREAGEEYERAMDILSNSFD